METETTAKNAALTAVTNLDAAEKMKTLTALNVACDALYQYWQDATVTDFPTLLAKLPDDQAISDADKGPIRQLLQQASGELGDNNVKHFLAALLPAVDEAWRAYIEPTTLPAPVQQQPAQPVLKRTLDTTRNLYYEYDESTGEAKTTGRWFKEATGGEPLQPQSEQPVQPAPLVQPVLKRTLDTTRNLYYEYDESTGTATGRWFTQATGGEPLPQQQPQQQVQEQEQAEVEAEEEQVVNKLPPLTNVERQVVETQTDQLVDDLVSTHPDLESIIRDFINANPGMDLDFNTAQGAFVDALVKTVGSRS